MLESYYNDDTDMFASISHKFLAGHSLKYHHEEINIPYRHKHTTYINLAAALALPKSNFLGLQRRKTDTMQFVHTQPCAVKPMLSMEGKICHFMSCVTSIRQREYLRSSLSHRPNTKANCIAFEIIKTSHFFEKSFINC